MTAAAYLASDQVSDVHAVYQEILESIGDGLAAAGNTITNNLSVLTSQDFSVTCIGSYAELDRIMADLQSAGASHELGCTCGAGSLFWILEALNTQTGTATQSTTMAPIFPMTLSRGISCYCLARAPAASHKIHRCVLFMYHGTCLQAEGLSALHALDC